MQNFCPEKSDRIQTILTLFGSASNEENKVDLRRKQYTEMMDIFKQEIRFMQSETIIEYEYLQQIQQEAGHLQTEDENAQFTEYLKELELLIHQGYFELPHRREDCDTVIPKYDKVVKKFFKSWIEKLKNETKIDFIEPTQHLRVLISWQHVPEQKSLELVRLFKNNILPFRYVRIVGASQKTKYVLQLMSDNTSITHLDMEDEDFKEKAADLITPQTNLVSLNLNGNNLCLDKSIGIDSLATKLKNNITIKRLHLEENLIQDNEVITIANALRKNITLEVLFLGNNLITDIGAQALLDALEHNNTLKYIYMSNNPGISDAMISKIHAQKTIGIYI